MPLTSEEIPAQEAEESDVGQPVRQADLRPIASLIASLTIFICLAVWIARTKAPWCDEGWFANPAYNLAFNGNMSSNVVEPSGHFLNAYLKGIHERTYLVTPNHLVALAGWFRLFGFSLFTMRLHSILWGVVTLVVFFYILRTLFPDPRVAQWTVLLMSIDFMFLWTTADGRMESPANALALCSLAAYLYFRRRNFLAGVAVSQVFAAAAVFTHPNALMVLLAVFILAWRFDRGQLRLWHLIPASLPYLLFGGLWSLYILQSPSSFTAQFFANAAGRSSIRWKILIQPWLAVYGEIVRHFGNYLASGLWAAVMNGWMVLIPCAYLAAMIGFLRARRTYGAPVRMFLVCAVTVPLALTFLNGFKAPAYLLYAIPFYDAVLAVGLLDLWSRGPAARRIGVAVALAFVSIQLATSMQHIRADEFGREYRPAIRALQNYQAAGKTIVGTAALGFGLGFHGFADDWRLGLYSGLQPDIIVVDRSYRYFGTRFEQEEPAVFDHIVTTLSSNYRLASRYGSFWIFERSPAHAGAHEGNAAPWVDLSGMDLQKEGKRAEYLFERLATGPITRFSEGTSSHDSRRF